MITTLIYLAGCVISFGRLNANDKYWMQHPWYKRDWVDLGFFTALSWFAFVASLSVKRRKGNGLSIKKEKLLDFKI